MKLSLKSVLLENQWWFKEGEKIARQIIKKWGNKPQMIQKAIEAADAAGWGKQQFIFPPELQLPEEGWMEIANTLREYTRQNRRY